MQSGHAVPRLMMICCKVVAQTASRDSRDEMHSLDRLISSRSTLHKDESGAPMYQSSAVGQDLRFLFSGASHVNLHDVE